MKDLKNKLISNIKVGNVNYAIDIINIFIKIDSKNATLINLLGICEFLCGNFHNSLYLWQYSYIVFNDRTAEILLLESNREDFKYLTKNYKYLTNIPNYKKNRLYYIKQYFKFKMKYNFMNIDYVIYKSCTKRHEPVLKTLTYLSLKIKAKE